jgi:two-component system response regulator HydG
MRDVVAYVRQIAASRRPVLFQGETGSGKEVLARLLHDASPRAGGPFVAVSMTMFSEHSLESSFYGHEKGVFDADTAREGLLRAASGGTLFLDDVADLPPAHQSKLLRAIEAREVLPVGGDRFIPIDTRIVAASCLELAGLVHESRFRADLYFRLSALRVEVPPLRARADDIPGLAAWFLARHAEKSGGALIQLDHAAELRLLSYGWPGNVRELANVVERAALVCSNLRITVADLPPEVAGTSAGESHPYEQAMETFERALIRSMLERVAGDRREAARALGVSLATLYRRIDRLGLKEAPGSPLSPRDARSSKMTIDSPAAEPDPASLLLGENRHYSARSK